MNPAAELRRNMVTLAKLPPYLRERSLGTIVRRLDVGDLIDLKAYFDAQSSIVFDEIKRRSDETYSSP